MIEKTDIKKIIKEQIRNPKLFLICFLILAVVALIIIKPNFSGKKSFEIEDKCGKFVNLMSYTVEDEAACSSRCRAQCLGMDLKYDKVEFKESNVGCNSCKCFCK